MPGGIFWTRRAVRRLGGVVGVATACGLWGVGLVISWLSSGAIAGALSFALRVMALPVMPLAGMPVAGGSMRMLVVVAASAAVWWMVGQLVAARVARRPVVGWRDWLKGYLTFGVGLWIGALGSMAIAAMSMAML